MRIVSDEELMQQIQNGNPAPLWLLTERYSDAVQSYLRKMLPHCQDVDSLRQEIFLLALRHEGSYRYPQKFSTWLFTIAKNRALLELKTKNWD